MNKSLMADESYLVSILLFLLPRVKSFIRSIPAGRFVISEIYLSLYQAWRRAQNPGLIPTREPEKAAGMQITRSWHGKVAMARVIKRGEK